MDERFLDSLYEAAVVPELWPEVLRRFKDIARGAGAVLVEETPSSQRWISSSPEFDQLVATHFNRFPGNERMRRLLERRHAGFLRDIDIFSDAEMATEPVYRDFLLPQGVGMGGPTSIASPPARGGGRARRDGGDRALDPEARHGQDRAASPADLVGPLRGAGVAASAAD